VKRKSSVRHERRAGFVTPAATDHRLLKGKVALHVAESLDLSDLVAWVNFVGISESVEVNIQMGPF